MIDPNSASKKKTDVDTPEEEKVASEANRSEQDFINGFHAHKKKVAKSSSKTA